MTSVFGRADPIVVNGPVRYTNPRFVAVLDSISAALKRQDYISQVVSVQSIGESTFVNTDRRTTFLIAALSPASYSDVSRTVVPELRETVWRRPAKVITTHDKTRSATLCKVLL